MARNYALLAQAHFRRLLTTRFCFTLGTQMQAVAIGWLVYDLTHNPLYLGFTGLAEALPALSLGLWAGMIVDAGDPKKIYRRAACATLLGAFCLLAAAHFGAALGMGGQLTLIFSALVLTGTARAFYSPSMFSLIPLAVTRFELGGAMAWMTTSQEVAALSGPALGGVIYAAVGAQRTFGVILAIFALVLYAISRVPDPPTRARPTAAPSEPFRERILTGVRFVFSDQVILAAMTLDMLAVLFGGATAILPVFARDILHCGPAGLGLLRASTSIGAFSVSLLLIHSPPARGAGKRLLLAVAAYGVCMLGFGFSRTLWISVACLIGSGVCDGISMVVRQTILQTRTPDAMRGRVSAVSSLFIGSSNEIGAFESGVAARFLGATPSVIAGGCITLAVAAITARRAPKLRALDL